MGKKRSTFVYLLIHDLIVQTVLLLILGLFFGILCVWTDCIPVTFADIFLVTVLMSMTSPLLQSGFRYEEFQMFHYTRKRFYRYQVLLCVLRAVEVALVRTGYQLLMREKFIEYYMEDGNTVMEMYHQVPFRELFTSSLCIIFIFNMVYLIGNTWTFNFYLVDGINEGVSPQNRWRIAQQKEQHPKRKKWISFAVKGVNFVCVVAVAVFMVGYYSVQMLRPFSFRLGILAILIAVCVGLFFVGKKRYRPEYI